ncbi:MAG: NAD(P)-dependent oxidoreductase [Burkholderiales bacterium]|nr:NAD(P)-dependent oxidoreductase [Burkholderiales bacterium]
MGEPMCRNLALKSGRPAIAFDLDKMPLMRLAADGIEAAPDVASVIEKADIVFMSLPSSQALETVAAAALAGAREGRVYIDLGTSPVPLTRKLEADFAQRGAAYLDAPVARTREAAIAGTLSVMVGGGQAVFERILPLFRCFAADVTHCGAAGAGQAVKILNNMVLFQTVMALSEALAIGRSVGLDGRLLFETMAKGSGDSFALRNHGLKSMIPGIFPERAFSVEYARKDLRYALELAAAAGIDADSASLVDRTFERAIAAGFGGQYHPVISRVIGS